MTPGTFALTSCNPNQPHHPRCSVEQNPALRLPGHGFIVAAPQVGLPVLLDMRGDPECRDVGVGFQRGEAQDKRRGQAGQRVQGGQREIVLRGDDRSQRASVSGGCGR